MFNLDLSLLIFVILFYGIECANSTQSANISDYPYHVSIEYNKQHSCSGVLINENWILTAAACVFRNELTNLTVRVATEISSTGGIQNEVRSIFIHEEFDTISYENDIALLRLLFPLEYGHGKLPIVLPSSNLDIVDETMAVVTGWVMDGEGNPGTQLTVISTPIVNQTTCRSSLPVFKELTDSMLCAGYMKTDSEVCQGDVGAPLVHEERLIGILSYGLGCYMPTFPSVYTRVNSFVPWILNHTGILF